MDLTALSAVQLAELLDVSEKTVRNWMNKNGLPFFEVGRGRSIEWRAAHTWWLKQREAEDGNSGSNRKNAAPLAAPPDSETYEDALARKTRAEADLKELQLGKARGEVASIALVTKVLAASVKATQTNILAIPSRLAPRLLGVDDHRRVVAILDEEMRQLLTNLATIDAMREAQDMELKASNDDE